VSPDAASYDRRGEVADGRERDADQREAGLDELPRKLHVPAVSWEERSLQAIERARCAVRRRGRQEVARIHDELAARRPSGAGEYRRIADEARKAASQAREIERKFSN
jgi:hypothetical protein